MPIVDLFSSRLSETDRSDEVWVFDEIPQVLHVQVSNIVRDALGTTHHYSEFNSIAAYEFIRDSVTHEHGRITLASEAGAVADVHACLKRERDVLIWLDVVELSFRLIDRMCGNYNDHDRRMREIAIPAAEAIAELNERLRRAGFGYRFEDGHIIRIDSEFMYQEATRPALALLRDKRFSGAHEEFVAAHDHFKAGEFRDCSVDALNALESTMKTICDIQEWVYPKGARATDLLKVLRREKLFPEFIDQSFEQLLATLKSGLPVLRNEVGGHGQGAIPTETPAYVAAYALNLAGAKIRFLVEALRDLEAKDSKA